MDRSAIIVYVAGPYRGATHWDVEQHVREAEQAALAVAQLDAVPLCPHTMYRHFDGQCDAQYWIDATLALLARCDAMVVVGDWGRSEGTRGEVAYCNRHGVPYFFGIAQLRAWLDRGSVDTGNGAAGRPAGGKHTESGRLGAPPGRIGLPWDR